MYKLAMQLAVCLPALFACAPAFAEAPSGVWLGGRNSKVELTKCGAKVCGRVLKEMAAGSPCAAENANSRARRKRLDGGWVYDKHDRSSRAPRSNGLSKLILLAEVASKLATERVVWKRGSDDRKPCKQTAGNPRAPEPAARKDGRHAPVGKKTVAPRSRAGRPSTVEVPAGNPSIYQDIGRETARTAAPSSTFH
jgi:hypothetical protein